MASLDTKHVPYLIYLYVDKKQKKVNTGLKDSREAKRLADKISDLENARKNGLTIAEAGLADWVKKLEGSNSVVYEKLVSLGLLPKKEKALTLADLCKHYEAKGENRKERTQYRYDKTISLLYQFFGPEKPVAEITTDDAYRFYDWFRTAPLNERTGIDPKTGEKKPPRPYSKMTIHRETKGVKSVFNYAQKLGLIRFNPFAVIETRFTGNADNKDYVTTELVLDVIEKTGNLKWKTVIALGRFAGCRGASDLSVLTWDKVHWSSGREGGFITLEGKTTGNIPLSHVLENLLRDWFDHAPEGEAKVFPDINEKTNVNQMVKKCILNAGVQAWKNPWYSLRTSFCNDVLESGVDLEEYRIICRHSIKVALEHYQKFHPKRAQKAKGCLQNSPLWIQKTGETDIEGVKNPVELPLENVESFVKYDTLDDVREGVKSGVVRVLNRVLQGVSFNVLDVQEIKREIINTLENTVDEAFQGTQKNLLAISCKEA